ncbi:hypothetical protein P175DRAFT_0522736 [Aspergillus ochraceoroseus IBT 24754]|uniref:Zn(2)-C6 fungal-type domain-containing protein n=1 Tax=Aspergillus ochraceoroseus IBT 24754 TaxID=1392256 RepID=A0A2T5LYV9_9EURO|nr:uncharacterized protein P175DRAFT_0522736 [Aspergillus ochraceoroseus IBT 24754]PTU21453.1 hypothetical protein P175DRAFT_0522736 [Aspergillus ochraceoroseus IBT 24754]
MQSHRLPPACDLCHLKKIRCDRQSPCSNCVLTKTACLRERPKSTSQANRFDTSRMDEMLQRMSQLEESIRQASSRAFGSQSESIDEQQSNNNLTDEQSRAFFSPKDTPFSSAGDEDAVQDPQPPEPSEMSPESGLRPSSADNNNNNNNHNNNNIDPSSLPPLGLRKRRAQSVLGSESKRAHAGKSDAVDESQSPECQALASIDLQRYFCNHHSGNAQDLARERHFVLESAIRLAKQVANTEPKLEGLDEIGQNRSAFYDPRMYPSIEFLHVALNHDTSNVATAYFLEFNETVSKECLEQMGLSLVECSVHDQLRLRYIICVNYLAYAFLTATDSSSKSNRMHKHLGLARLRYRRNVLVALKQLDTRAEPELSLLQAIVSAAMLMQDIGNMRGCWRLNRLACRICASLNQSPVKESIPEQDRAEIRMISIKCYVFDKALSAHVYQPACSDVMEVDSTVLVPTRPGHAMLLTLLEIASVQDALLRETRHWNSPGHTPSYVQDRFVGLQQRMLRIARKIQQYRSEAPCCDNEFLSFEWLNLEFVYYSMMTSVIRLGMKGSDPKLHQECLQNARNALLTLTVMLDFASRSSSITDKCINSLAWVVPLFSLRPIYFIFSTLVATSEASDLDLLQDISRGLSPIDRSHYSLMEIKRLCDSLIELYKQFSERMRFSQRLSRLQIRRRGLAPAGTNNNLSELDPYKNATSGYEEINMWSSKNPGVAGEESLGIDMEDLPFAPDPQDASPLFLDSLSDPLRGGFLSDWDCFAMQTNSLQGGADGGMPF